MDSEATSNVLGMRWDLGEARPLHGSATVRPARLDSEADLTALAEIHPIPPSVDGGNVVADVSRSAGVTDQHLLEVLDVGMTGTPAQLYVVTEMWDDVLEPGAVGEAALREVALREVAAAAASALSALHEADRLHGCLHRASLRRVCDVWKLAPAGLADVQQTDVAPYRPPGLHVMEPPSAAADLWNLGIVLHELANGRLLRPGEQPEVADAPVIHHLVGRLLQKDPKTRPSADDVLGILDRTPVGALPTEPAAATVRTTMNDVGVPEAPPRPPASDRGDRRDLGAATSAHESASTEASATDPPFGLSKTVMAGAVAAVLVLVAAIAIAPLLSDDPIDPQGGSTAGGDTVGGTTAEVTERGTEGPLPTTDSSVTGVVELGALEVGDCVEVALDQGLFSTVERVACDAEHRAEVIAVADPPTAGDGADYPGRRSLSEFGDELCGASFVGYVGSSAFDTVLGHQAVVPTFGDWQSGDRQSVICLATRFDGGSLDRSVADGYQQFRIIDGSTTSVGKIIPGKCFNVESGDLSSTGKRQDVTVVGCLSLHRYEVFDVVELPIEESDETGLSPEPDRYQELADLSLEECALRWDELTPLAGAGPAEVRRIMPDVYDWQVGDRSYACVIAWENPIASSAVLNHNLDSDSG